MRMQIFAGFALFAIVNNAGAATAPRCERLNFPNGSPRPACLTAIADDWYLTPGLSRTGPYGVRAPITATDSPHFKAGTGVPPGTTGSQAVYLSGVSGKGERPQNLMRTERDQPSASFREFGGLTRSFSLESWRGKRLRLTLRLRNEGGARAYASAQIGRDNETGIRTATQRNAPGSDSWQTHRFVMDVPYDAGELAIVIGLTGKGTIWLDDARLEAVNDTIPVTWTQRVSFINPEIPHPYSGLVPVPGPALEDD